MKKLFLIIGAIAIFMVLVAGMGFYWVSASVMATAKSDAVSVVANGMAQAIAKQINPCLRTTNDKHKLAAASGIFLPNLDKYSNNLAPKIGVFYSACSGKFPRQYSDKPHC